MPGWTWCTLWTQHVCQDIGRVIIYVCDLETNQLNRIERSKIAIMSPTPKISYRLRLIAVATSLAFFAGCATTPQTVGRLQYAPAAGIMREARSSQVPVEKRGADYLQAAAMTAPLLGTGAQETPARNTYNAACGELAVLLRSGEGGRLWNNSLTFAANNQTYHLRLQSAAPGVWAPDYFTSFELPWHDKREIDKEGEHSTRRRWCACWSAQCYSA